jgi:hypothetical protein
MDILRIIYLGILLLVSTSFESGASFGVGTFLIPSILMGIGVAIDVALATLAKFQDDSLSWRNWTFPVTFTHVLFPAFGYFLFWFLDGAFPLAHSALGIIGFLLVFLFLYEVIMESLGKEASFGLSAWISKSIGLSPTDARTFVAILAVSWDALWSGPAKAAQASAGNWNGIEVILSFIIAGVVVATVAETSLALATRLRRKQYKNRAQLALYSIIGKYFELSVIGGFGVLSLWNGFSTDSSLYITILISALLLLIIFSINFKTLLKQQTDSLS